MKILCCMVTYNRLEYTKKAIWSWQKTSWNHEDRLVVVDNGSTDGTREWLSGQGFLSVQNPENLFPGAATNIGWHHGLKGFDADLLMRSDNDIMYLPGWRDEVVRAYTNVDKLGLLGVLNFHEDYEDIGKEVPVKEWNGLNVHFDKTGGNCVIPRHLYDRGVRWRPGGWAPGGLDEDTIMADTVNKLGYRVAQIIPTVAENMSFHRYSDFPEYYQFTAGLRGLVPELSV